MHNHPSRLKIAARQIPIERDYLSPDELSALSADELTRRTAALAPMIAAHAAEAEAIRRPVDCVWAALRRSGFFYQFVPAKFGGMETDIDSFIDAILPIAEACASTAWVAAFCAEHNWMLSHFPEESQAEIWGGAFPYIIAPAVTAPPGKAVRTNGGFIVNGTWKWGTGVMHADWILASALLIVDPRLEAVEVTVRKLRPPLALDVGSTGVRVRRAR